MFLYSCDKEEKISFGFSSNIKNDASHPVCIQG